VIINPLEDCIGALVVAIVRISYLQLPLLIMFTSANASQGAAISNIWKRGNTRMPTLIFRTAGPSLAARVKLLDEELIIVNFAA
jgi:hypothetical protein